MSLRLKRYIYRITVDFTSDQPTLHRTEILAVSSTTVTTRRTVASGFRIKTPVSKTCGTPQEAVAKFRAELTERIESCRVAISIAEALLAADIQDGDES